MRARSTRRSVVAGLAAAVVLAAGGATAATEESPLDQLGKAILGMQGNITNANMKLKHGMVGTPSPSRSGEQLPPTIARQCCSGNMKNIRTHMQRMFNILQELELFYSKQRNRDALNELRLMRGNLQELAQGMAAFDRAPSHAVADAALKGLIVPFNSFREGKKALARCCPVPGAAAAETQAAPDDGKQEGQ